VPTLAVVDSP